MKYIKVSEELNKRFKNKSPSGLTISAFSLKIKPQIAPMITQPKRIIVLL